jgi:diguanylate cyclase (GGDEF)-like protein
MPDDFIPLYQRITTGQIVRRPTEMLINERVQRIQQRGEGALSIVCLDIDGFSAIERSYNYLLADALLDAVMAYLEDHASGKVSYFARYVRDSFLVVYDGLLLEDAFLAGESLRRQLSETTFVASDGHTEKRLQVTFSAGVATFPGDPEDASELVSQAEDAARRAYEAGGGRTMLGRAFNKTAKTSHYSPGQLDRLKELRGQLGRSEASLLREALDDLLRKYDQRDIRRRLNQEDQQEEGIPES